MHHDPVAGGIEQRAVPLLADAKQFLCLPDLCHIPGGPLHPDDFAVRVNDREETGLVQMALAVGQGELVQQALGGKTASQDLATPRLPPATECVRKAQLGDVLADKLTGIGSQRSGGGPVDGCENHLSIEAEHEIVSGVGKTLVSLFGRTQGLVAGSLLRPETRRVGNPIPNGYFM